MKTLLLVDHAPSINTKQMAEAVVKGVHNADTNALRLIYKDPLQTQVDDVLTCDGIILGTTENFAYMSGAMKDFFDRIYYPCLDHKRGLAVSYYIRAGNDGTGCNKAISTILSGLNWKIVQPMLLCKGPWQPDFVDNCYTLGETMATGLDLGVF